MDKNKQQKIEPGLYLISTPIGNMKDITYRAIDILKKSDIILCEDTRRSVQLLSFFGINNKLTSYHKFNESKVSSKIVDLIKSKKIISLVSDAGTPTVSDPGIILINKCIKENLAIYPIPGPSSVTAAASASGFNDQYIFYGFLPKKEKQLENVLKGLSNLDYSIIFFIPSNKIVFYITKFKSYFSDRKIVIAKEMTKIHEEFIRGDIKSIKTSNMTLKGELTVVISKKVEEKNTKNDISDSVKIEIKKMLKKYSHKDVVEFISKKENLPKKMIYNFCLKFIK